MNQTDRDSLTALLNQTKDIFQNISHQIHWSPADSGQLDDFMNSEPLQKHSKKNNENYGFKDFNRNCADTSCI